MQNIWHLCWPWVRNGDFKGQNSLCVTGRETRIQHWITKFKTLGFKRKPLICQKRQNTYSNNKPRTFLQCILLGLPYNCIATVWPEPIWIKVNSSWLLLPQHQSTYLRGPESASIEIPPFRAHFIKFSKTVFYQVNLVSQCSHLEVLLLSKFGSEMGDLNLCRFWAS